MAKFLDYGILQATVQYVDFLCSGSIAARRGIIEAFPERSPFTSETQLPNKDVHAIIVQTQSKDTVFVKMKRLA